MKKLLCLLLCAMMVMLFASCGNDEEETISDSGVVADIDSAAEDSENVEESEPVEEELAEDSDSEIRADFKEAMDDYESFMDEYVAFMKKFANSDGTDLSILSDYADYMSKYTEAMESFEKWDDEDLNDAELAYYLEVQNRVTKKLLEVSK